jgi:hypothetical protein
MNIARRRWTFPSTRGQQAIPNNNNPKPAIRTIAIAALEIFVPNKNLVIVGAMINTIPVTVSNVEATTSNTLSITPGDYLPLWQPMP